MTSTADASAEAVTDDVHENSWSANLEREAHAADRELVIEEAIDAVEQTAAGYHVNLVTHGAHGHPSTYLDHALATRFPSLEWEYVDQCGCGGHVTRVHVE